jgi:hypothetical protein
VAPPEPEPVGGPRPVTPPLAPKVDAGAEPPAAPPTEGENK